MYGQWIYFAIAVILGCVFVFTSPFISCSLFLLIAVKLLIQKQKKILMIYCLFFIFSLFISFINDKDNQTDFIAGNIETSIQFLDSAIIDGNRMSGHVIAKNGEKFAFVYFIRSFDEKRELLESVQSGTVCMSKGTLVKPGEPRNEHAFNYETFLYYSKIHWIYEADQLMTCMNKSQNLFDHLRNKRGDFLKEIEMAYPPRLIPYAQALLFGDRTQFEEDVYRSYQKLGIVHLLAISGLHIGLFVAIIYYLLLRIGLTREQIFYLFLIVLPIYALLSGANPPVLRAVTMTLLLLFSTHYKFLISSLDTLAISCITFLLLNPYALYQVGFQLSYIVSFSIILSVLLLHPHTSYIRISFYISIISTVCSIPIMAYHFYEISFISLLANLIFVPFYSFVIVPLFLFTFILQYFSPLIFSGIISIFEPIIVYSESFVSFVSELPFAMITLGKPSFIWLLLFSVAMIGFFIIWEKQRTMKIAAIPIVLLIVVQVLLTTFNMKGEVIFIDVGQGDSILIQLPLNRGTYLIDTGGVISFAGEEWEKRAVPYQVGKKVITPLLKSKGITKIDKLILTHGHFDHVGGASELFDEFQIKEVLIPPNAWEQSVVKEIIGKATQKHTEVSMTMAGDTFESKSGIFTFLSPTIKGEDGNNNSLVLFARFGGYSWLFTGDLEEEGEVNLLKTSKNLKANVLKVGHHGSKTSTTPELLQAVSPEIAIISVGENNRYNHPSEEVVNRFVENNVTLLRTDTDGAIHYKFTEFRGTIKGNWRKIKRKAKAPD